MTQAKHTPLPWTAEGMAIDRKQFEIANTFGGSQDMDGNTIGDAVARENAAFIVRAVNSHYELLGCLKSIIMVLPPETRAEIQGHIDSACDAIAKAEGGAE